MQKAVTSVHHSWGHRIQKTQNYVYYFNLAPVYQSKIVSRNCAYQPWSLFQVVYQFCSFLLFRYSESRHHFLYSSDGSGNMKKIKYTHPSTYNCCMLCFMLMQGCKHLKAGWNTQQRVILPLNKAIISYLLKCIVYHLLYKYANSLTNNI